MGWKYRTRPDCNNKKGENYIGTTKFTNSKIKKSELTKLKEIAKKLDIKVVTYVIFSKKGFSSELKSLKGENLKLLTPRNFNCLLDWLILFLFI